MVWHCIVELCIASLISLRHWSARACTIGSAVAVLMFLTTLSFLFSTPGWEPRLGGFPALSRWAVLDKGRGPARGCIVVAGRGRDRNKGTRTGSMIVRNIR